MTEKRYFKEDFHDEYAIKKEDIIIAVVDSGSNAWKICGELNALNDENEELKEENIELKHDNKRLVKFIKSKGFFLKDYLDWLKEEVWND